MAEKNDTQGKSGTRERILAAAARLFAERGYAATSVRDIAAELGIANPSLYYHFKSKAEILVELLGEPLQHVEAAAQDAEALTGEARTRRIIQGLLEALEVHSGLAITALQATEQLPDIHQQLAFSMQAQIAALLAQATAEDHPDLRLTMAMAGVQGVVVALMRSSEDEAAFVAQLREKREIITDLVLKILQ